MKNEFIRSLLWIVLVGVALAILIVFLRKGDDEPPGYTGQDKKHNRPTIVLSHDDFFQ